MDRLPLRPRRRDLDQCNRRTIRIPIYASSHLNIIEGKTGKLKMTSN